jgi:hypothetical protein
MHQESMARDIARTVQIAMLGEVPSTLRFLYVSLSDDRLNFFATFDDEATDEHLEAARRISTEVLASCPGGTVLNERIEQDSHRPWKIGTGENLMYLRFGELSDE